MSVCVCVCVSEYVCVCVCVCMCVSVCMCVFVCRGDVDVNALFLDIQAATCVCQGEWKGHDEGWGCRVRGEG